MTAGKARSRSFVLQLVAAGGAVIGCATAEQTWSSGPLTSPGGRWIAEVHDDTHGWNTYPLTVVEVRRANETSATVVLQPRGDWSGGANLELRWPDADVLQIAVPNRTVFDRRLQSYQGIAIQVIYRNENVADRDFWCRRQAGRLFVRQPEGPMASKPYDRNTSRPTKR